MLAYEQLRRLASFRSERFSLTSFYWKFPPVVNRAHREELILIENALRESLLQVQKEQHDREWMQSFGQDEARILEYFGALGDRPHKDFALFSCSGESFWQVIQLPRGVRGGLFAGDTFHLEPLTILLDQFHRYCTVMVDRTEARVFEVYLGEINERSAVLDEVLRKVRVGGAVSRNDRQIERRIENKAHQHFKRAADKVLELFKTDHFDWLILGGHQEGLAVFENHLHSYLRPRVIGKFAADLRTVSEPEILEKSLAIAGSRDREEKAKLVEEIVNKAGHGGLGVVGLKDTLLALELGEVHTLVVDEGLDSAVMRVCRECELRSADQAHDCPACGRPLQRLEEILEHAVEAAISDRSQIRFVNGNEELLKAGGMGALLRFRAQVPSGLLVESKVG